MILYEGFVIAMNFYDTRSLPVPMHEKNYLSIFITWYGVFYINDWYIIFIICNPLLIPLEFIKNLQGFGSCLMSVYKMLFF